MSWTRVDHSTFQQLMKASTPNATQDLWLNIILKKVLNLKKKKKKPYRCKRQRVIGPIPLEVHNRERTVSEYRWRTSVLQLPIRTKNVSLKNRLEKNWRFIRPRKLRIIPNLIGSFLLSPSSRVFFSFDNNSLIETGCNYLWTRSNDHAFDPESDESQKRTECHHYVRIIGTRLFDHTAQFRVAISTDHRKQTCRKKNGN